MIQIGLFPVIETVHRADRRLSVIEELEVENSLWEKQAGHFMMKSFDGRNGKV